MKRVYFIMILSLLVTTPTYAQDFEIHPYLGASFNFLGITTPGWGVELGAQIINYYVGFEYGDYGSADHYAISARPGEIPSDYALTQEMYIGLHVGIKLFNNLLVGAEILSSKQTVAHTIVNQSDTTFPYRRQDITLSWFNIGPDLRFYFSNHFIGTSAYTVRRGLKIGAAYVF